MSGLSYAAARGGETPVTAFESKLNGTLYGLMQWADWEQLQHRLRSEVSTRWYVTAAGAESPDAPLTPDALRQVVDAVAGLLKKDHLEDYLGIVYVDDVADPTLIKIYDPNNLGSSCGSIGYKVQPGWVLSLDPPVRVTTPVPLPGNRQRWWASLRARLVG